MSRKSRIWYPGATYHVISRGNRKGEIFLEPADYIDFLEYLASVQMDYPFTLHAICLMTNHFHMEIGTQDVDLSVIMRKLLSPYAANFNHKYHLTGHVFENRYTAELIEDERYFLEVSRYIHLNPFRARIVQNPSEYEYSSIRCYLNAEDLLNREAGPDSYADGLIRELADPERVLKCFHTPGQYSEFMQEAMRRDDEKG